MLPIRKQLLVLQTWTVLLFMLVEFAHSQETLIEQTTKSQMLKNAIKKLMCDLDFQNDFVADYHTTKNVSNVSHHSENKPFSNENSSESLNPYRYDISKHIHCASHQVVSLQINFVDFHLNNSQELPEWFQIGNVTLHKDAFCIQKLDESFILIQVCGDTFNKTLTTMRNDTHEQEADYHVYKSEVKSKVKLGHFRKCCKENEKIQIEYFDGRDTFICTMNKGESLWDPALFSTVESKFNDHVHLSNSESRSPPKYSFGMPDCSDFSYLTNDKDIWFKVLENGDVKVGLAFWFRNIWLSAGEPNKPSTYCTDEMTTTTLNDNINMNYSHNLSSHQILHRNQILIYCKIHRYDEYIYHKIVFGTLCVIASLVLAVVLGIYLLLWDKQSLSGWTQFNIFLAVFLEILMHGVRTLDRANLLLIEETGSCRVIALVAQIVFFAVNTSWSVMCWDLCWTFRHLGSTNKPIREHTKRAAAYLFFSWVLPAIVVVTLFSYSDNIAKNAHEHMEGTYVYAMRRCTSPIRDLGFKIQGIMLSLNAMFFIFTAFLIWRHQRDISANLIAAKSSVTSQNLRSTWITVKIFGKLLLVMGVASLSIPIDYFFGSEDPFTPLARALRCVHLIPVVFILFLFGLNEKNIRLLSQKYPRFRNTIGRHLCAKRTVTPKSSFEEDQKATQL